MRVILVVLGVFVVGYLVCFWLANRNSAISRANIRAVWITLIVVVLGGLTLYIMTDQINNEEQDMRALSNAAARKCRMAINIDLVARESYLCEKAEKLRELEIKSKWPYE